MFETLFPVRPVGVFGLLLAAILTLRALADLPTMIWLRPRLAGGVTLSLFLLLWALIALALWAISGAALFWLAFLAACVIGLPASREAADLVAFRRDAPSASAVAAAQAFERLRQDLAGKAHAEAEQDAWDAAEVRAEAAKLLADLTGEGRFAYRGHIYRKGAVDARMDFVAVDDQPRPWVSRWRSAGDFVKAGAPPAPQP